MKTKSLSVLILWALTFSALMPFSVQAKAAELAIPPRGVSPAGMLNPDGTLNLSGNFGDAVFAIPARAFSSTITVNSIVDDTLINLDANPTCDLREAITNANSNTATYSDCAAGAGADTINFSVSGTVILGTPLPWIADDLSIDGSGQSVTISGNSANFIVEVISGKTVSLNALTIANGSGFSDAGIINYGILTISNSTFANNNATAGNGGGIYNFAGATLTVYNSTFSNNNATVGLGGGIYNESAATLTIYNSTFSGNSAVWGSAIYNQGTLHMKNTILANSGGGDDCYNESGDTIATNTNNLIEDNGPSGHMCGTPTLTGDPKLGDLVDNGGPTQTFALVPGSPAINAGDKATCNASPISNLDQRGFSRDGTACDIGAYERVFRYVATTGNNTANNCLNSASPCLTVKYAITQAKQGDVISIAAGTYAENTIFFNDLEAIGAGMNQTILDGGSGSGITVVHLGTGKTASLADLTIRNGNNSDGGGIISYGALTLKRVKVTGNQSTWLGGGISAYSALTMIDSVVSANTAFMAGGGMYINTTAAVNLTNVTISGNTATTNYGGGMYQDNTPTTNLTNVTISGNTAALGGGGISTSGAGGTINILNSTIANNHVTSGTVGGITDFSTLNIKNTIVAGNDGDECGPYGTWTSQGYNLSSDATCNFTNTGDQQNTDPLLGSLADNGGYSQTHALLSGSPAIDMGTDTGCPDTDQRGVTRPFGTKCDMGAYEVNQGVTTYRSGGAQDGWVLESGENTKVGGTKDSASTSLRLGDDATRKQYRSVLSFNTSNLPDTAVITKVTLKVKRQGITGGGNPVSMFQGFMADIKKGTFGTSALQLTDFQALGKTYGPFTLSGTWYVFDLTGAKAYINKLSTLSGLTQIRLRFKIDDNNNNVANYLSLYSGNAPAASRPQLIIEYYVP